MSISRIITNRRGQPSRSMADSARARRFRPSVEMLEIRECPSITAPTGLQLTAVSATQVKLAWNDVQGESGYQIYKLNGLITTLVATLSPNTTTFTVNQLTALHQYSFKVTAFDATTSASSAWATIVTSPSPITAPTNVQVIAPTLSTLTITWGFATNAAGYRIYQWNGSQSVQIGSVTAATNSFKVSNLAQGTPYTFSVQAYNATNAASSALVSGTTMAIGITAPGNLRTQVLGSTSIQLNWNDAAGETGYHIYALNNGSSAPTLVGTLAANTTSFQATGLLRNTTYWFYVQAFNGTSSASTVWVSATTQVGQPLTAPTNFTINASAPGTALLSWTASAEAAGYNIYYWNGFSWVVVQTVQQGVTKFQVTGVPTGQTSWFLIQAFTANNVEIANSNPMSITM